MKLGLITSHLVNSDVTHISKKTMAIESSLILKAYQ
jgi:hypothetical protein